MNTIKIEKGNALMVAHRGLKLEAQNTAAAFVAAGNRTHYGIETDIYRTADGKFVCLHDNNLMYMSGEMLEMEKCSLSVYQSVILFDKDRTKSRVDLRTPSLENYLSICKKYEKTCVLELKSDFTNEEIAKIVEIINSFDLLENVIFISFIYENLVKVKQLLPTQRAQYLVGAFTKDLPEKLAAAGMDVDIEYRALSQEHVTAFHDKGVKVNCWTVNDKETAEKLVSWGVDFITTDILE